MYCYVFISLYNYVFSSLVKTVPSPSTHSQLLLQNPKERQLKTKTKPRNLTEKGNKINIL